MTGFVESCARELLATNPPQDKLRSMLTNLVKVQADIRAALTLLRNALGENAPDVVPMLGKIDGKGT